MYQKVDTLITELKSDGNTEKVTITSGSTNKTEVIAITKAKKKKKWKYHSTSYGKKKFKKYTVAAIAIIVSSITKIPASAKIIVGISSYIFSENIKTVYYKKIIYKKTGRSKLNPCFKTKTNLYKDSKRKKAIKKGIISYAGRTQCP
ncbi:hypothetical protein GXN76_15725 [Kroppenstedtia pulmonis]|uniref:Uncharacterized protein n=1 Tax=Kroppenstedtia pulmonis TaxID=1380685 RepID=A0A7D3Y211_9BACL|nr:hypothetical protein [Kroppenstedtia pulmonis]QKG85760.1 hypothetical protein GXN76_15725 [Kroppenstedtia pulmonis]